MCNNDCPSNLTPLYRVFLFGQMRLERREATSPTSEPAYASFVPDCWNRQTPWRVLAYLLTCAGRQTYRDPLIDALWPDEALERSRMALSIALSQVRLGLLDSQEQPLLTPRKANEQKLIRLASQESIWCDWHAFTDLLIQAQRAEQQGKDALALWEQAYALAREEFLLAERYNDWCRHLRERTAGDQRLCLIHLAACYSAHGRPTDEERLLRHFLSEHPQDEDILYRLVTLLLQQGRSQEALRWYQQTLATLEEEGMEVTAQTQRLLKRIRGESDPSMLHPDETEAPLLATPPKAGYTIKTTEPFYPTLSPSSEIGVEQPSATWFNLKQQLIQLLVRQWQGRAMYCDELQGIIDQELQMADSIKSLYQQEAYTVSRRSMLTALALLPLTLQTSWPQKFIQPPHPEVFLPECAASITSCWNLLNGDGLTAIEQALPTYLPTLVTWSHQPSRYQPTAASLAAQGSIIMRLATYHQFRLQDSLAYANQAVELAKISGDHNLLAYALTSAGFAAYWTDQPQLMLQRYQEAERILQNVAQPLQSAILAGLAHAYAQNSRITEAQYAIGKARDFFSDKISDVPCYASAHCSLSQLIITEGMTHLALGTKDVDQALIHYNEAKNALALIHRQFPNNVIPQRNYAQIVNYQARAAIGLGDLDEAERYLLTGMQGATALGSEKRRQEVLANWQAAKNRWPLEKKVLALGEGLLS